jgi:hypothetical protein
MLSLIGSTAGSPAINDVRIGGQSLIEILV